VIVTTLSCANGIFTATVKNQSTAVTLAGVYIGVGDFVDGQSKTYGSFLGSLAAGLNHDRHPEWQLPYLLTTSTASPNPTKTTTSRQP
jgi:hypothetical protein